MSRLSPALAFALLLCILFALRPEASTRPRGYTGPSALAIPAYFYPGEYWTQLTDAYAAGSHSAGIAVMNPSTGPGNAADAGYVAAAGAARASGTKLLGYVDTAYGRRAEALVRADVARYYDWYGVDGIFFDQASTACAQVGYYKDLYGEVKGRGGQVVLNPGTQTNECYMSIGNTRAGAGGCTAVTGTAYTTDLIIVGFEGSYRSYVAGGYRGARWTGCYPALNFWHLVYNTPARGVSTAVSLSRQRNAAWVYVSPARPPNPWNALPTGAYWQAELAAAASKN